MFFSTYFYWGCHIWKFRFCQWISVTGSGIGPTTIGFPEVWSHFWDGLSLVGYLDQYKPITLLKTELKMLAKMLMRRLQSMLGFCWVPDQTVKGWTVQTNLHLICTILKVEKTTLELWWSIWISPRFSIWSNISSSLLSCGPPNSTFACEPDSCIDLQCCGAGDGEVVYRFCAITYSSLGLSAVAPTLHFNFEASPSQAEAQGALCGISFLVGARAMYAVDVYLLVSCQCEIEMRLNARKGPTSYVTSLLACG